MKPSPERKVAVRGEVIGADQVAVLGCGVSNM